MPQNKSLLFIRYLHDGKVATVETTQTNDEINWNKRLRFRKLNGRLKQK